MHEWGQTSGYMSADGEKRLYEMLDSLDNAIADYVPGDEFAEALMTLTGTVYNGGDGSPVHHPGIQADARRVVLRWLRDRGRFESRENT